MEYSILLNKSPILGQMPVIYDKGEILFFLTGSIDNFNHTIILSNKFQKEIGRLYLDNSNLINSYIIDVTHHPIVKIIKLNNQLTNLFYITKLNYWVKGSIKKGNYSFYKGLIERANVKTIITTEGNTLDCNIQKPEDVPFILLTSILFTQWHITPLSLPSFPVFHHKFCVLH
ncbi:hypothetical protein [Lactobacillus sp. PV034]|uniref:hypothetical protein n=1 Tax=Lactobacillus sp. PV034 TaxID=2594495 RepID=UPI00223F098C|nr:hypothetical protein [Lactobacillus sp. PV034]QNQ80700.1 hypothetical protein FP432_03615 [Lactobacillus sp. PV034]